MLISHVLVKHCQFFKDTFEYVAQWHIEHKFYQEMSQMSIVVRVTVINFKTL